MTDQHKRIHAYVYGRVQGVAFREYTRREATALGLKGWVRNRTNGSVETVAEGRAFQVELFVKWLGTGSPYAEVRKVECLEEHYTSEETSFHIRFSS